MNYGIVGLLTYCQPPSGRLPTPVGQWHKSPLARQITAAGTVQDSHLIPMGHAPHKATAKLNKIFHPRNLLLHFLKKSRSDCDKYPLG